VFSDFGCGCNNLVVPVNSQVLVIAARSGTFYGRAMKVGNLYSIASAATSVGFEGAVTLDRAGNMLVFDSRGKTVQVVAVRTGRFNGQAMTAGDIYTIAGDGTRGFFGDGGPAVFAGLNGPEGLALTTTGDLLISDFGNDRIRRVTG
jgi:hypothetical protein